ncbi:Ig-like domain-containing protein [Enterobacter soli]|uniref:Ig-like domain-containing protein n=1 Tax=Enterobacter soli TaxID=885040 RepID=UPI003ED95264
MSLKKGVVYLQISLQILPSFFLCFGASTASAQEKTPDAQSAERTVAQGVVQAGSQLENGSAGAIAGALTNQATGAATREIESWLNQLGTTRINISTDEHFSLQDADLDLLVPLYEQKDKLIFTQLGGRRHDDRNIVNAGLGYREFNSTWMWGVNSFYDRQVSANQHQRLGAGAELGWDYLRLSANGYYRLSSWKASSRYRDYDERVANGFDLRATGYLPAYPQLGANLVYEQYYGNHVGLFGDDEDDRQKDPYAITLGLNYTPVPLITMGVNQKSGKGNASDTQFNLALTWAPGVPLGAQLDPDQVGGRRTLMGSRKELVDRNNAIVLDYRKQELITLSLPENIAGQEKARQSVSAKVKSKYGLERMDWQGESLIRNGGKITVGSDPSNVVVTLPAWRSNGENAYQLTAQAWDKHGNASNTARMMVSISGMNVNTLQSSLVASPVKLPANGTSQSTLTLTLKTASGEVATGLADRLSTGLTLKDTASVGAAAVAPKVGTFREVGNGVYTATFTSGTTPATITAQVLIDGNIKLAATTLTEESTAVIAALASVTPSSVSSPADGVTPVTVVAKVLDQAGNALAGQVVSWSSDKTNVQFSEGKNTTNAQGEASVKLTSKDIVAAVVTAKLDDQSALSTPAIKFVADVSSAQVQSVSPDKKQVVANNSDSVTYSAQVTDSSVHPLEKVTVNWNIKRQDGSLVGTKTSVSDSLGNATLSLSSAKTGVAYVYADVNQQNAVKADAVTFVADTSTQRIDAVTIDKKEAIANGNDSLVYTAQVYDVQGNPISGVAVNWSADNTDVKLAASSTTTDDQGNAQIAVTSLKSGSVIITAQTAESAPVRATSATFTADATTATLINVTSDKTKAIADGNEAITLSATAADANGNLLEGQKISWEVDSSAAMLSAATSESDSAGVANVALRSASVGVYSVKATLNGSSLSVSSLNFTANISKAQVTAVSADKEKDIVADSDTVALTATVQDENHNPVSGATVDWSSSLSTGVVLTPAVSTTNAQGQATARFSSLKAGMITVTATTNGSSQSQALAVIGNAATARFVSMNADKTETVADGNAKITWTATVQDANDNPLSGLDVAWGVDNSNVTLSASSSKTDTAGKAVISGSTTVAGVAAVTATAASSSATKQSDNVSFIGDVATARIESITAGTDHAVVNTDRVTYTTVVKDVNNNLVPKATVNWSTSLNDLSAQTSVTDVSGLATVKLSGPNTGTAMVTAEINGSSKSDNTLIFIASYKGVWNISSTTGSSRNFTSGALFGFPSLGFVATGSTQGPTSLQWEGSGYSTLTVPLTDEQGKSWDVVIRAQRVSDCSSRPFNSAITCSSWETTGYSANLQYLQADNPDLPGGVYHGDIKFLGKDWHSSWSLDYTVTTTLTNN